MSPQAIASLPTENPEVATTSSQATDNSSQPTSEVQPTEPTKVVEEPTPITVLAFIKAPLAKGITMTDLRQKVGHEKGKAWTAKLNEYVDAILSFRSQRRRPKEIYDSLRQSYHTTMGSLVAALLKIPLQPNGSPIEAWEKLILCSNPKGPSNEATKEAAKDARTGLGQAVVGGTNELPSEVDDYASFSAVDGPWT